MFAIPEASKPVHPSPPKSRHQITKLMTSPQAHAGLRIGPSKKGGLPAAWNIPMELM